MTWRELLDFLKTLEVSNDHRLDLQTKVWDVGYGEYYETDTVELCESDDILDAGHLFLGINYD